jgi:hypothetical protein
MSDSASKIPIDHAKFRIADHEARIAEHTASLQ